jgi:hypothetical protein
LVHVASNGLTEKVTDRISRQTRKFKTNGQDNKKKR